MCGMDSLVDEEWEWDLRFCLLKNGPVGGRAPSSALTDNQIFRITSLEGLELVGIKTPWGNGLDHS